MLTDTQLKKIKAIVSVVAHEPKTITLVDDVLNEIEEELGGNYTIAYALPSEMEKRDIGCAVKFIVIHNETGKFYSFSVIPTICVLVERH